MPVIFIKGPYRFFFYSNEGAEPPHIHVQRDNKVAKFWLSPVVLEKAGGFARSDIGKIEKTVAEREQEIIEAWHDYFGSQD